MRTDVKRESSLTQLQGELGYSFADRALARARCLTHVSYDRHKSDGHNEVLEFLGDAVLDLAVSDLLIATILKEAKAICRACARRW